jgi:3,4-dihydroxy 2-butanone 4-phosphate synthase / GTP cyclohydrolase II
LRSGDSTSRSGGNDGPERADPDNTDRSVCILDRLVLAAVSALAAGRMAVITDARDEGHLVVAAQLAAPDHITFMTRRAGGWICLALTAERCAELGLRPIARAGSGAGRAPLPPFTVTIEAARGVTTGISAADQAHTIRTAADPATTRRDLVVPGHVRPVRTAPGGVREQPAHAEAAIELARLAGLAPAAVTCQVQNDDGSVARGADLISFCARHGLPCVTIAELLRHRRVERVVATALPTAFGAFTVVGYREHPSGAEHVALVKGDLGDQHGAPVHVHRQCVTGDVFHALRCDCGAVLEDALRAIETAGRGVVVYVAGPEHDDPEAVAAQVLADLGVDYSRSSTMALAMPPASQTA